MSQEQADEQNYGNNYDYDEDYGNQQNTYKIPGDDNNNYLDELYKPEIEKYYNDVSESTLLSRC